MNHKKILHIDMDGVIANFDKAIKGYCPDLETTDRLDNYEERSKMVDVICETNPTIFETLEPIDNAIDSVLKLSEHYEICFLSTPMYNVPQSYSGKRLWLESHFGEFAKKRLILTHRKDLVIGDYLIDDRTRNGADEFKGELIQFGTDKFPNWDGVVNYLISKLPKQPTHFHDNLMFDFGTLKLERCNEFSNDFKNRFPNGVLKLDKGLYQVDIIIENHEMNDYYVWLIGKHYCLSSRKYVGLGLNSDGESHVILKKLVE